MKMKNRSNYSTDVTEIILAFLEGVEDANDGTIVPSDWSRKYQAMKSIIAAGLDNMDTEDLEEVTRVFGTVLLPPVERYQSMDEAAEEYKEELYQEASLRDIQEEDDRFMKAQKKGYPFAFD